MPKEILGYFFILHNALKYAVSVFHASAIVTYNPELAKNCIRSVLSQQREDGFISSMVSPYSRTYETQPQVLAWGVWEVYQKTKEKVNRPHRPIVENKFIPLVILIGRLVSL